MAQKLTPEQAEKLKVEIKKIFDEFDTDKSGHIESKEFENVLVKYNSSSECKKKLEPAKIKEITAVIIISKYNRLIIHLFILQIYLAPV